MNIFYRRGTILSMLCGVSHLILTTTSCDRSITEVHYHFIGREMDLLRLLSLLQSWDLTPGNLTLRQGASLTPRLSHHPVLFYKGDRPVDT